MNETERASLEASIQSHLEANDTDTAITETIRGYGPEILGFLVGAMGDETAASEAFSTFTEDLVRGIAGFRWSSSLRVWCYVLARNASNRYYRDPFLQRRYPLETREYAKVISDTRTKTLTFLRTEVKDGVARIRERLTPNERTLLILHVDRNMNLKEVAKVMSTKKKPVSHPALRKRFQRIKEKIRELALEEGLIETQDR